MANSFSDLSLNLFAKQTLRPQSITGATNGVTVDVGPVGTSLLNAVLSVGAVNTLTSLDVKIQASTDDSNWDDISGAAFTTVTAANAQETISFQIPAATSSTAPAYRYVRAVAAIVGTSALTSVLILGNLRYPNPNTGYKNTPPTIN